jgi:GWxTD domain-containing protein
MLRNFLTLVVAASMAVAAPAGAQDALSMRAVRYYRADDAGKTLVKAFVEVPYSMLQPSGSGADAVLTYSVSARVLDSSGMSLLPEALSWRTRVPASMGGPNSVGIEPMQFAVTPGVYRLEVTVADSVSGRQAQVTTTVEGYGRVPPASDLLLSPAMRVADANDTVPQPGEMRWGNTLVAPVVKLRLSPLRPQVFYFLEAYNTSTEEQAGTMEVAILGQGGSLVTQTPPQPVRIGPGGGILKGSLDLDGLPEGAYTLQVTVNLGGTRTQRAAELEMAGLEATLASQQQQSAPVTNASGAETDEAYFAGMSEAQLDTAAAPLILLVSRPRDLRTYESLSLDAKRRFLAEFWKGRDQTPATARNEERERFYGAIAYANEAYRVGRGRQELGWQTDRGRIYAKYGAPDDRLRRVQAGGAPPYEVWRYTRGRSRWFIFADRTGIGGYNLIHTNDLQENGIPSWQEVLTPDAVRDIGQFLGQDFLGGSSGSNLF